MPTAFSTHEHPEVFKRDLQDRVLFLHFAGYFGDRSKFEWIPRKIDRSSNGFQERATTLPNKKEEQNDRCASFLTEKQEQ